MRATLVLVTLLALLLLAASVDARGLRRRGGGRGPRHPAPRVVATRLPEINSTTIDDMWASLNDAKPRAQAAAADDTDLDAEWDAWRAARNLTLGAPDSGTYGLDVSDAVDTATFACLKSKGFDFAIVRIWESVCQVDPNGASTVDAAWAGGMNDVDVYLFPSFACGLSPAAQVDGAISALSGHKFGMLWLDIEAEGSDWGSPVDNVKWINAAVAQATSRLGPGRVGIYTNANNWQVVTDNVHNYANVPVWYAHYDGDPSFADWEDFGAWTQPAIKQWSDSPAVCGASIDHNWYP